MKGVAITMPLHEKASYEKDGQWITITPEQLRDTEQLALAREKQLYDSEEQKYELFIRNRENLPHFYRKGTIRHNLDRQKDSSEHDEAVKKLHSFLKSNSSLHLKSKFFRGFHDKKLNIIKTMHDYTWDDEVTFAVAENGYVRFDLLGRPNSLNCTNKNPFVAFEVVDTHFSSKASFQALLELSKKLPFVIGYFFVKNTPYFNCPKNSEGNALAYVRVTCYIHDGDFWIRDERISDTVTDALKNNPDAYYEYIYEKVKREFMVEKTFNRNG